MKIRAKLLKKLFTLALLIFLLFEPVMVFAQSAQNPQTTPSPQATASDTAIVDADNTNNAQISNDTDVLANTGDNSVISPTPAPTEFQSDTAQNLTPTPTSTPAEEEVPKTSDTGDNPLGADTASSSSPTDQLADQTATESAVTAFNEDTPGESQNSAVASNEETVEVENNNSAEVKNDTSSASNTGGNAASGTEPFVKAGDASATADLVNVINTNLTGENFWQAIINLYATSENDIDLSSIETNSKLDPTLIKVLAENRYTGDGSVNIALANFLSSFSIYNSNEAILMNNVDVSSITGQNQATGDQSSIDTGDASSKANIFNMVNTNITGENWFFGIINLFGNNYGNLILPYELQFLENNPLNSSSVAVNENTQGSQSTASAQNINTVDIDNTNTANISNNISVTADTGGNTIEGEGNINTGDAQANANLLNFANTNITGDGFLFLLINNFGGWTGKLSGWWGNLIVTPNYTVAWAIIPGTGSTSASSNVLAVDKNTGNDSQNSATALFENSFKVENTNDALIKNNVNVTADTGGNTIEGEGNINTGDAKANANVFNFVNTNIVGNNWFFGIVNIFNDFTGDIIFPRPDLSITKTADKQTVSQGEEVTYTISYKNEGKTWAKDAMVTDPLPSQVSFVSASDEGVYSNGQVKWNIGKVNAGVGGNVSLIVKVNSNVANDTQITNSVIITTSTDELGKDNNSAGAIVTVFSQGATSAGGNNQNSEGNTGMLSICSDSKPGVPTSFSGISGPNAGQATLSWIAPATAYSYFLIAYSNNPNAPRWGNPDIGNTTSFTVSGLGVGTFYFWVRAGNNCMPGDFTGPITVYVPVGASGVAPGSVATGFGEGVLGASTEKVLEKEVNVKPEIIREIRGAKTNGVCDQCIWWPIILGEIIALAMYYIFFSRTYYVRRKILIGLAIPIVAYTAFLLLNRNCNTNLLFAISTFSFCKYFWLVDGLVFIAMTYVFRKVVLGKRGK